MCSKSGLQKRLFVLFYSSTKPQFITTLKASPALEEVYKRSQGQLLKKEVESLGLRVGPGHFLMPIQVGIDEFRSHQTVPYVPTVSKKPDFE